MSSMTTSYDINYEKVHNSFNNDIFIYSKCTGSKYYY